MSTKNKIGNDISIQQQQNSKVDFDISPQQDGGILKRVIREGTGEETPLTGDKVFLQYVGTLKDGSVFASSREKGNGIFDFRLDRGAVIKAWDIGVSSMKRGEVAVITCTPEYAYGDTGKGPIVGPCDTLMFEIELINWEGEDLTAHKDGGVIRRILKKGVGHDTPNDRATVNVRLRGKLGERVFDDRELSFTLGEGSTHNVCRGLETALKKMRLTEHSRLHIKSTYAFGKLGKPDWDIPADADIIYEAELLNFKKAVGWSESFPMPWYSWSYKESSGSRFVASSEHMTKEFWEMNSDEKIEQARLEKEMGGNHFKNGNPQKAAVCYKRVVVLLEQEECKDIKEERDSLLLASHLNLALCYLKLEHYHEAERQSSSALVIDPHNEKGFYRRGQARVHKNLFELAIEDFKDVLKIDLNNKAARKELNQAVQKLNEFREKEKNVYLGMFNKLAAAKEPVPAEHLTKKSGDDVFQSINEWNNDMAKDMISLEQELEAFGETMPVKSSRKHGETTPAAD